MHEGPSNRGAHRYVQFVWRMAGENPVLVSAHVYSSDEQKIELIVETIVPYAFSEEQRVAR